MLALVIMTIVRAMRLFQRMPAGPDRRLLSGAFLGLVTYYIHGALNNFLDTDKASVPFWAFTTMIVLFDIKYAEEPSPSASTYQVPLGPDAGLASSQSPEAVVTPSAGVAQVAPV